MFRAARVPVLLVSVLLVTFMTACGGGKKTVTMSVSIAQGSSLSLDMGQAKSLTATVANDSQGGGVSWSLSGAGTLTNQTTSSVTYNAPATGSAGTATVTATSVTDSTKTASITITMNLAPSIAVTPVPAAATNGTAYSFVVPETGGSSPFTWSVSTGALPAGLTLDSTGKISGTPNANATSSPYTFTVKVLDNAGMSATQNYSMTVNNPAAPVISSTAPPAGTAGTLYSTFTFTLASGGLAPFTWSETGALPAGLTLSASGALAGTPTASGSFPITVSVQDSSNPKQTATLGVTLQINNPAPPTIGTTTLPDGAVGASYSQNIQASGGLGPFTWSVSSGTLPAGLNLSSSTTNSVTLTGIPTTLQSSVQFTVQVRDSLGQTATQSYTINIAAQPIVVTISNKITTIQVNQSADFTATVQGDTQGVIWTLTTNGMNCEPGCGTLSKVTTTSVSYTAPATVPSGPDDVPLLTATSVTDNTKLDTDSITITATISSCAAQGNEAELKGQYAFNLSGYNSTGYLTVVGSFTADGTGKLTAGEADSDGALGVQHGTLTTSASSYSVDSDGRGCAMIATPFGTFNTRIVVGLPGSGVATKGHIIENEIGSSAYIAAGQVLLQTPSSFTSGISGNYVFLTPGVDSGGNPFASIGSMNASAGLFSNFVVDSNDGGTTDYASGGTGSYGSFDSNGRATGNITVSGQMHSTFAMYIVNASDLLVISMDTPGQNPVNSGEVRSQTGTFSAASLNGTSVMFMMGSSDPTQSVADVGTLTTGGAGSWSANITDDSDGTLTTDSYSGTYTVASSGRTVVVQNGKQGSGAPIIYLTAANTGFMMSSGDSVETGELDPQTGTPFTLASLNGTYMMGSVRAVRQNQETDLNWVTLSNGNVTGVGDYISTDGNMIGESFTDTTTVTSAGGIETSDNPTIVTAYAVSDTRFVMMSNVNSQYPNMIVGER